MQQRFIVYKASAGSGKTFTLAVEYLALLLSQAASEGFRHILAVTFTNMATAEMKGRILEYLYLIAHGHDEKIYHEVAGRIDTDRPLGRAEIQERAQRCLTAILHDYTHFRVETIDSFLQSVLRNMAHELGLNANLRVELDDKQLIGAAVDQIIDNLRDDRSDKAKGWIQKLLSVQLDAGSAWDVASAVKAFATCIFDEAFLNRKAEERQALRNEETLNQFVHSMRRAQAEAEHAVKEAVGKAQAVWQESDLNVSYSSDYEKMMLRMSRMEPMKMSERIRTALYTDSTTMLKKADVQHTAEAEELATMLRQLCDDYTHRYCIWLSARLAIHDIDQLRLLGLLEDTADAVAEENNQFALSKTPSLLSQLIGRDDAPFVFEKAGTTFHHVMIDEFQDTSQMQWSNFRVLLLENLSTQGHDMVVGDIKQSIYRWRNGDWRILQQMEHDSSLPIQPEPLKLDTNYRSEQRIVTFNNCFFDAAARALDAIAPHNPSITELYADVKQQCVKTEEQGYVQARLFLNTASNEENYWRQMAMEMAGRIDELNGMGVAYSQIAILVREKNDGAELIRQFRTVAPHITLVSNESYLLEASPSVQLIVAAIRVLTDPTDRIAEAYLRKYDCPVMEDAQKEQLKSEPLYMMCESLYRLLQLERIKGQEAYVMAFFDEVQNFARNTSADLQAFLTAWDDSLHKVSVPCGNIAGVQVITIHKSKGLQFHTVLLPATHWKIKKRMNNEKIWMYASDPSFNVLGPLPIAGKKDLTDTFYAEAYKEELFQKRVDALNILYVAFTRAECNLLIWGTAQVNNKGEVTLNDESGAGEILYAYLDGKIESKRDDEPSALTFTQGELKGISQKETKDASRMSMTGTETVSLPLRSYPPTLDFRQSNESQKFIRSLSTEESDPQTYTDIGKLMHYVLSQIETESDIPHALQQCEAQGIIQDERMRHNVINRLKHGFTNKRVKEWFSEHNTIINECNIIGTSQYRPGQVTHRPDRIVMHDNTLSVVDYKFARPDEEHAQQVRAYMDLLQQMHPEMQVEGFLWYVYSGHVEQIYL